MGKFDLLKGIKGVFYDDDSSEEEQVVEEGAIETKAPEQPVAEAPKTGINFGMPTSDSEAVAPGTIVGSVNEKFYEIISKKVADSNLEGNDLLEFVEALTRMQGKKVDEATKFELVFAALDSSSGGITKEQIMKSVQHYLSIISAERTKFGNGMANAMQKEVQSREESIEGLMTEIEQKEAQIEKLKAEIITSRETIQTLTSEKNAADIDIKQKEADFDVTASKIETEISAIGEKIEKYIQ